MCKTTSLELATLEVVATQMTCDLIYILEESYLEYIPYNSLLETNSKISLNIV